MDGSSAETESESVFDLLVPIFAALKRLNMRTPDSLPPPPVTSSSDADSKLSVFQSSDQIWSDAIAVLVLTRRPATVTTTDMGWAPLATPLILHAIAKLPDISSLAVSNAFLYTLNHNATRRALLNESLCSQLLPPALALCVRTLTSTTAAGTSIASTAASVTLSSSASHTLATRAPSAVTPATARAALQPVLMLLKPV
jgi:hypothetical protein